MSDLDVLQELINERALVPLMETPYGGRIVVLGESGSQGEMQYSIKIKGIPNDAVVVKTDMFPFSRGNFFVSKGRVQACRLRYRHQFGDGQFHRPCRNEEG